MMNLNDYVSVGQNSMYSKVIQHSDTSEAYSSGLKNLLATPKLIHMAIESGIQTIDPYLPDEYISVGISTSFTHTAATSLGMTVTVRTTVIAVEEHDILLEIKAWDEQGDIGHGLHKRAVLTKKEIEEKAAERARFLINRQS
jgi:fluoroacetyl-CoA thioesterase